MASVSAHPLRSSPGMAGKVGGLRDPLIKASYFAGNVKGLDALGAAGEAAARRRLTTVIEGFDTLSRLDWVPLAWDVELNKVVFELAGMDGIRRTNKRSMLLSLDGPLVRPFVSTAVSLLGPTPKSLLKFLPKVWAASTKDLGPIDVARLDDDAATLVFPALPKEVLGDAPWLEGFCGLLEGIFDTTRHVGVAASPRVVGDQAVYELSWKKG